MPPTDGFDELALMRCRGECGSLKTKRYGSSARPPCWRGLAPGFATSTFSRRPTRCCAARRRRRPSAPAVRCRRYRKHPGGDTDRCAADVRRPSAAGGRRRGSSRRRRPTAGRRLGAVRLRDVGVADHPDRAYPRLEVMMATTCRKSTVRPTFPIADSVTLARFCRGQWRATLHRAPCA